ncbi:O-antigen ligase family protein [Priestia megaterium]|uniref:O-antigen ligase family protein n=1 Tax=Priestia megaterium TaxID=1404 RepID=UPI000BF64780|nr:O-antigen ligase family protein [Priestia megaterium]PFW49656.1 hypothetical protein COL17_17025 [Priestia megaterium]
MNIGIGTGITNNNNTFNNSNKKEKINSLCIALFLCARLIVLSLPVQIQIDNILVFLLSLVFAITILNNRFVFYLKTALVVWLVILAFLITFMYSGPNSNNILYLLDFFVYGGIGLYLSSMNFSIEKIYKYIVCISILLLPLVLSKDFQNESDVWMGLSYSILPLLFAGIIYITTVEDKIYFKYLTALTLFIYIFKVITFFTRGALLASIIFVLIFIIVRYFKISFKRNFILLIMLIIIWCVYTNLESILILANGFLLDNGMHIRFIEKTLHLMAYDNLLNGRDNYYELAIKGIKNSPLFGNGIGSFETDTGLIYVHNLFLQLAYEGGIFFVVPCTIVLIQGIYMIILSKKVNPSTRIFIWFIFAVGIFRLLVSSVYWGEQTFWYLLGFIILYKKSRSSEKF